MADIEEAPKQEEVVENKEETQATPAPVESKDEVAVDAAPLAKSSSKSPSKSPAKSPKKSVEAEKSSPLKSVKTSPTKSPKKAKKYESEEEEEEETEEKKGVLDMPLVIEGKRKRESTSFLKVDGVGNSKHKTPAVAGTGTALGDIPFIAHQIETEKSQELRVLYRICYKTMGKMNSLKKELRKFNGFSFAKDSEEYTKKSVLVMKNTLAELHHIRRILGLSVCKSKEEEVGAIIDFLLKPHDEGKKIPQKAVKRKSAGKVKAPAKKSKEESSPKKKVISKEKVDTDSDEDEKSSDSEVEEEVKTPKKTPAKRKAVDQKAKTPKKAKKEESADGDEAKVDDHSVTSSSDASEKKEEKPDLSPTDQEVKTKISELLKTFDLTSVSMKQMVTAVCSAFPDHPQLNDRTATIKAFIKDAIKEEEE